MKVARWTSRLRQIDESGKVPGVPTDKADRSPSVSSVSTLPPFIPEIESAPGTGGESPLDPLSAAALAKLVADAALQRAAVAEPTADHYRVGIAIRDSELGYVTAIVTIQSLDWVAILNALQKADSHGN